MSGKWRKEEIDTLYEMAEAYTVEQIAFRLKKRGYCRTPKAITHKLYALGYSIRPILDNYSCCEIAKNLCVHPTTVIYWIRSGWLNAKKQYCSSYQIKRRDLKRFFNNPPKTLKTQIAALDPQIISYLVG